MTPPDVPALLPLGDSAARDASDEEFLARARSLWIGLHAMSENLSAEKHTSRAEIVNEAAHTIERLLSRVATLETRLSEATRDTALLDRMDALEDARLTVRDEDGDDAILWWRMATHLRERGGISHLDRPIREALAALSPTLSEHPDHE